MIPDYMQERSVNEASGSLGWVTVADAAGQKQLIRYDDFVRLLFRKDSHNMAVLHSIIGLTTEVGEVADAVKKAVYYEQPADIQNLIEEIGDIRFYLQALMNQYHIPEQVVLQHNASKLNRRYASLAFSLVDAERRADKDETGA